MNSMLPWVGARNRLVAATMALGLLVVGAQPALGELNVGEICRVKGQERNTLQGMGLVVGLKGTGDGSFGPTARSLIQIMNNMGIPMTDGAPGAVPGADMKDARNVALVVVTAEVPAHGARQGDELECTVSAVNAKSLAGGVLLLTPMLGPVPPGQRPENAVVYAFARGPIQLEDPNNPTTARVSVGCRMEQSFMNPFVKDDKLTLVLDRSHARFEVAEEVAFQINDHHEFGEGRDDASPRIARPIDQMSIEVTIPAEYRQKPVEFAARVLEVRLVQIPNIETVVVNETTGVIAMSADLEIAPHALQHQNMVIEIAGGTVGGQFVELDPQANTSVPTLQALVQSLNALRVSAKDMIAIIRALDRAGAIHGRVIYER
jgi:flagellar P-ring protein precursor FlgI